ncbi:CDP-diacylglycerol--serine O-phosphatidyltransferase [Bacillus sp. Au-Bac7]|uniref:CDP-diacylglycerol--serine O-phosphatidyltransferase n=1 Tax=Bacillus sp. Au-Bac7 TaxID=2906458 RepID=UPI001E30498E|nr:CDP-diacylglycerol--serine O-phosphatidyltransferase [Bacillus sp. Au-Bac7]MCE4048844.1 CDP-diacylglycerol--serine O-phosphatidyltransferase [Bacillus sp. Au-Bac7]
MIYLANIITICNFICGVLSIYSLLLNNTFSAMMFICFGMFFDLFDGRVARKFNTVSELGKELDSLSDLVTFSIAPAMLAYSISLSQLSLVGLVCALAFSICGLLRLARFNVEQSNLAVFIGLPAPAAAMCLLVLMTLHSPVILCIGICILAFLMVSHIKIPNFKKQDNEKMEIHGWK